MATPHVPVMVAEVSAAFGAMAIPLRRLIDCTVGAAGHTTALVTPTPHPSPATLLLALAGVGGLTRRRCTQAAAHPSLSTVLGLDLDPVALHHAQAALGRQAPALDVTLLCAPAP